MNIITRLIVLGISCTGFGGLVQASEWSYSFGSRTVTLEAESGTLKAESGTLEAKSGLVAVKLSSSLHDTETALQRLLADDSRLFSPLASDRTEFDRLWILRCSPQSESAEERERDWLALCHSLHSRPEVEFAAPVLRYQETRVIPKPELLVSFDNSANDLGLDGLIASLSTHLESEVLGLSVMREFPSLRRTYLLQVDSPPTQIFETARRLSEHPSVWAAQPNFILELESFGAPSDPLFSSQWTLDNQGQVGVPGVDIDALSAWQLTTGSSDIVIAVIDEGVDVDHEDLVANLLPGHDSTDQPSPGGLPGNALDIDPHGTTCAGIAAARGDNGLGGTGVSWSSKILPVRVGYASFWTQSSWMIDAITWSADNGADILSNSWGGSPPSVFEQDAINYAKTTGRGGLGCLVLFATGNSNTAVAYPAAYPETIAIGATSPCDERKTASSCDGETWWGSNFGAEIDLVAPGPISWTTDLTGTAGFSSGDYYAFSGTSAACPHVAGALALLLSLFPNLPEDQAAAYLTQSCEDLVGLAAEDTPGWDPYMGWGRLNARALLDLAILDADPPVTSLLCQEGAAGSNDVELTWVNGAVYTEIRIRRDGETIASLPGGATSFVDLSAPTGNKAYEVQGLTAQHGSLPVTCLLGEVFVRGEVDAIGGVSLSDAGALLAHLAQGAAIPCRDAADVNDSGTLDLSDALALLNYLFLQGPAPAAPFPAAGLDPSPDSLDCG